MRIYMDIIYMDINVYIYMYTYIYSKRMIERCTCDCLVGCFVCVCGHGVHEAYNRFH